MMSFDKWQPFDKFPEKLDEEVYLTNGKDITRAKFDKKKKAWSYATALMWNATHWCRKKDFEEIFPKREEGK
jgi:hypothetical protein